MWPDAALDLEFDKVAQLVAAQARSGLGRERIGRNLHLPTVDDAKRAARLTRAVGNLIDDHGPLSFSGIDDALPWLRPDAPSPTDPRELLSLLTLARRIAAARRQLATAPPPLGELAEELLDSEPLVARVAPRLDRDGTIPDHASPELQRLRRQSVRLRQELVDALDGVRRRSRDITTDAPPTVRRDRYCIPVKAAAQSQLAGLVLDTSASGATVFVEPLEIVDLNNRLAVTIAGEAAELRRIVAEIAAEFRAVRSELAAAAETLAELDAAQAKALFGNRVDGRVVDPGGADELILRAACHPLLDERLRDLRREVFGDAERRDPGRRVVPLDFRLPKGIRTAVISGPNAGGKTVVLKTIGLAVLMAYHGIPLPCDEGTAIPHLDAIWCHVGDDQDVTSDLSSFSGAMANTARLLDDAADRWLVLYDELGSDTDPMEGAAIGCALLETLADRRCLTVVTSHLAAISLAAGSDPRMETAAMGFDESAEAPTFRLAFGRPGRSRALEIARRTGLPRAVLERGRELLGGQHLELDRWLRRLEQVERDLAQERAAVAAALAEARETQRQLELESARIEDERQRAAHELAAQRERLTRRAKQRLDEVLGRLDRAVEQHEHIGRRQRQRLRDRALDLDEDSRESTVDERPVLAVGDHVRVTGMAGDATLEQLRGDRARVALAGKRLWVSTDDLSPAAGSSRRPVATTTSALPDGDLVPAELLLLGMDSEQARDELERFLDRAVAAGRPSVRVVHGHGAGVLRRMVADFCREHPAVHSFAHPPQHLGGTGATEITLETD